MKAKLENGGAEEEEKEEENFLVDFSTHPGLAEQEAPNCECSQIQWWEEDEEKRQSQTERKGLQ